MKTLCVSCTRNVQIKDNIFLGGMNMLRSKIKNISIIMSVLYVATLLSAVNVLHVEAASKFDTIYYAATYPDVLAVVGTDQQMLLNHYLEHGINEGRLPYEGTEPGVAVSGITDPSETFDPEYYAAAYTDVASYASLSIEEQLYGISASLRQLFNNGMAYSMSVPHYNDPHGYFVLGTASCAGCTRTTGLCLNILGISYEHVNENQYSHQWCRINVNGVYWICDAYGLYCGQEPAPNEHPYLK